jgi:hypothetical protein
VKAFLTVDLAIDHVVMRVRRPSHGLFRWRWRVGQDKSAPKLAGAARTSLAGSSLEDALDHCWSQLKIAYPHKLDRVTLDVQLSSAHVFIGLMELPPSESSMRRSGTWNDIVESWAGQVWLSDSSTRVTRWQQLDGAGSVLVSSTDRSVHEACLRFAQKNHMRFRSCLPAALSPQIMDGVLESSDAPQERNPIASDIVILWTECTAAGQRVAPVQLLRWAKGAPNTIWRGWIPSHNDIKDDENALTGAVRRFLGSSQGASQVTVLRMRWPNGSDVQAPWSEP